MGFDPKDFHHLGTSYIEEDRAELARLRQRCPGAFVGSNGGGRHARRPREPVSIPMVKEWSGRILAFDPSIENCGWAVVDPCNKPPCRICSGCWHPSKAVDALDRFDQLAIFVRTQINAHLPQFVVVELPNPKPLGRGMKWAQARTITYGRAVGLIEGVARSMLPGNTIAVDVEQWKGKSGKETTAIVVKARLGFESADDNIIDSCGLALWLIDAVDAKRRKL